MPHCGLTSQEWPFFNSLTGTTANDTLNGGGTIATNISGYAGNDTITSTTPMTTATVERVLIPSFWNCRRQCFPFAGLMSGEDGNDYISFTANDAVASTKASFMGGKGGDTIALGHSYVHQRPDWCRSRRRSHLSPELSPVPPSRAATTLTLSALFRNNVQPHIGLWC